MRTLAPIILFVYDNPCHTEQTLEALSKNDLADQSTLYVVCDGYKKNESEEVIKNIRSVREICKKKQWAKEVIISEKETNEGKASSIINGVTRILEKYGNIIVLEDDLITSPGFLTYMNDALDLYASDEKVMHISSYWFPIKKSIQLLPEIFFCRFATSHGWATWKRAWAKLETDAYHLKKEIGYLSDGIKKFNIENSYPYLNQLEYNVIGKINTWAIKWYASIFLNNGLCLHPNISLVNKGMNTADSPALSGIRVDKISLEENITAVRLLKQLHKSIHRNFIDE
nr:glycosyltransferase [Chitinophaga oryziterrae]